MHIKLKLLNSDHNAWGMTSRISWIEDINSSIRIPKAPVMLDIETAKAQGARAAAIGFAINGVSMYKVSYNLYFIKHESAVITHY